MVITTQVTFTTTGVAQQLNTAQTLVRWIAFQNNGTTVARVGGANTLLTVGYNLTASGGNYAPHVTGAAYFSVTSDWWLVGTTGAIVDVNYVT
jgi:hypothetical protein